jgi:prepilin-type N-terminal cleavage/methylation domain-containing protein
MDSSHGAELRDERGFTLIELMVVVAVIAILAIVVVPTFFRETRKTQGLSEVAPMFAEFTTKLEQYKIETGAYPVLATCPSTTSRAGSASSTCGTAWNPVRLNPPATLACQYQVGSGTATDAVDPTDFPGFTMGTPATAWFWVLATCDMDGNSTTNAQYFMNSLDTTIQKLNEGN